jgi:hypothetical protein
MRIADYRTVSWNDPERESTSTGLLVEWSGNGLALLASAKDAPSEGACLVPKTRPDVRGWNRPAIVRRTEQLSSTLQLIIAEFVPSPSGKQPPATVYPDRRGTPRDSLDRRRSKRWRTNKTLTWRVHRGRRDRHGRVIEQSLDGLVMLVDQQDELHEGDRFSPSGRNGGNPFTFQTAIVRRTRQLQPDTELVFAEIEA